MALEKRTKESVVAKVRGITQRQQERRDRILECTRQQVARLGYDGVNLRLRRMSQQQRSITYTTVRMN